MKRVHLTEMELQRAADNTETIEVAIKEHVAHCPECQIKVENYRMINSSLKAMSSPAFNFDLAEVVSKSLVVEKKPASPALWLILSACTCLVIAGIAGAYGEQVFTWFLVLPRAWGYLLSVPAAVFLVIQSTSLISDYQRKMNRLLSE